jgi:hypothetical protein
MLEVLLIFLIIFWALGYIHIDGLHIPSVPLITLNHHIITLWDLIIFIIILWVIGVLPSPFREIAGVLLILWVLSILGILMFAGLSNLIIIAIIVGIVASFIRR